MFDPEGEEELYPGVSRGSSSTYGRSDHTPSSHSGPGEQGIEIGEWRCFWSDTKDELQSKN